MNADGIKNMSKRKRPLVCQFANTLEETTTSANLAVLEGKYWKRRLESITNEYKKWRELSRRRLKPPLELHTPTEQHQQQQQQHQHQQKQQHQNQMQHQIIQQPNQIHANLNNVPNMSHSHQSQNHLEATQNSALLNVNNNYNSANESANTAINSAAMSYANNSSNYAYYPNSNTANANTVNSVVNEFDYLNHNSGCYLNSSVVNNNNFYSVNGSGSFNDPTASTSMGNLGPATSTSSTTVGSSQFSTANSHHYHHTSIASKQMTYNNRCRSPSPGLFQDFDLFNFSSDTLFSTHCFEDPKDPGEILVSTRLASFYFLYCE